MGKRIGVLSRITTVAAATVFVLAWASGFIAAKVGTLDESMWTVLFWRYAPLAVVLVAIAGMRGKLQQVPRRDLGRQAFVGAFSQFGYVVCVYASVAVGVTSGTTALIDAVQPLVIATLVGPLLRIRVRKMQWVGLALGVVGVVLVVSSQLEGAASSPLAYALPVLAMGSLIAATFAERRWPTDLPVFTILTVHLAVAALGMTVVAAVTGSIVIPSEPGFWITVAFTATVPALLAYALYWWLIRRIGITSLNALLFAVAPTTAVAGAVAFGEVFTSLTAIGFVVSAAAVALVIAFDRPRHQRPAPVNAVNAPVDVGGAPVDVQPAARAGAIRER
jgi:drug/metabolite transporter (DMT)-like permease